MTKQGQPATGHTFLNRLIGWLRDPYQFRVVYIEADGGQWVAHAADVGKDGAGPSKAEALEDLREALAAYVFELNGKRFVAARRRTDSDLRQVGELAIVKIPNPTPPAWLSWLFARLNWPRWLLRSKGAGT